MSADVEKRLSPLLYCAALLAASSPVFAESYIEQDKLTASDAAAGDNFGYAVAVSGNTIAVGAFDDGDSGEASGSAYIFAREGSRWVETVKLTASDGAAGDQFGYAIAVSGSTTVVGAWLDDDHGDASGSAYVFTLQGSEWIETAKLTPSDAAEGDKFGWSVAVCGTTVIVGSRDDDDNGTASGSAYVFRFNGSEWVETAKLTPSDGSAGDQFGWSTALSGSSAIIGAWTNLGSAYIFTFDGLNWVEAANLSASDGGGNGFGLAVSISGDTAIVGALFDDDNGDSSGSAYIFTFDGSTWVESVKLTASDGSTEDFFGYSVSLSGDTALIGARGDDDGGVFSGAAYLFSFDGSDWLEAAKLVASDATSGDVFGDSVAVSGTTAVVGAWADDDHGSASGSAYVFITPIFTDGFETGDTSEWSAAVP